MKCFNVKTFAALGGGAILILTMLQPAVAAGTTSGVDVDNTATIDYKVGGVDQTAVNSNLATFKVDNKVDLTVTSNGNASAGAPGSLDHVLSFTVTNTGNTTQGYVLSVVDAAGDTINMDNVEIWLDANGNGTFESGTDTLYSAGANAGDILPDNDITVFVVSDTPISASDGDTASYTLVATTLNAGTTTVTVADGDGDDSTLVEVVFADGDGSTTQETTRDGKHSATATYTVASAALAVNKSSAVIADGVNVVAPFYAIPGATVEYTIGITNNGGTAATDVVVSDPIPANTSFVVGSISSTPAATAVQYSNDSGTTWTYTPVADGNGVDTAVTDVRATFLSVASGGGTAEVKFQVKIN